MKKKDLLESTVKHVHATKSDSTPTIDSMRGMSFTLCGIDHAADFREVLRKIEEIQAVHPELYVFFDGDEYAICGSPRKQPDKL